MRFTEDYLNGTYTAEYTRAISSAGITLTPAEEATLAEGIGMAAESGAKLDWVDKAVMIREMRDHIAVNISLWLEARGE